MAIMRYCKECDRDLAEKYVECPFCKNETETREVKEIVVTPEEQEQRRQAAREAKKRQKTQVLVLGLGMLGLLVLMYFSQLRIMETIAPIHHEWFLINEFKPTMDFDLERSPGELAPLGIVNDSTAMEDFEHTVGFSTDEPIDFTKYSLVYSANSVKEADAPVIYIELFSTTPFKEFLILAPSAMPSDHQANVDRLPGQDRMQSIHLIQIEKISSLPSPDTQSAPFSRLPE